MIRPAAKWSGASRNVHVVGHSSTASGVPTGDPGSAPSTSRKDEANSSLIRQAIHTPVQPSTSGHIQQQPGSSSHTLPQPKPKTNLQQLGSTSVERHTFSSAQTPSTSTNTKATASTSRTPLQGLPPPQPSTSGLTQPQAGPSAHQTVAQQARTPSSAAQSSCAITSSSAKTREKASTSTSSRDNPQASTSFAQSHAQMHTQPGTSTQVQPSAIATLIQVSEVNLVVVPQQPSTQAPALITQPQPLNRMQGNLIQIEPQPLAQAPAQPPAQVPQPPQGTPPIPPAVLIAAAPERLGPPEAGHRIILGSQAPEEPVPNPAPHPGTSSMARPTHGLSVRLPNVNPNAPPVATASAPSNRGDARLMAAPSLIQQRVNPPAPVLVAVPPAPEDVPHIEDARPGPSAPHDAEEQQSRIRNLISRVVSITSQHKYSHLISCLIYVPPVQLLFVPPQLDLFPDVQEACVAELIQKNNVTDLNV